MSGSETPRQRVRRQVNRNLRMEALLEKVTEAGLIPVREGHPYGGGRTRYRIGWHLPWYDGQIACGIDWVDPINKPRAGVTESMVCAKCLARVQAQEPGFTDKVLTHIVTRVNRVLKNGRAT